MKLSLIHKWSCLHPVKLWVSAGLGLLLFGLIGCTRETGKADSHVRQKTVAATASEQAQQATGPNLGEHRKDSIIAPPSPPALVFIGETWVGKTGSFAILDTKSRSSAWYRVGDKIGDYEIVGLQGASLLIRSDHGSLLLPLSGIEISQSESAAANGNGPASGLTLTVWSDGRRVEATPDKMPPELLKSYNDSKEAMLSAKVPPELEPMIAQALDSKVVIVASGKDGFKRSDFPPEMSAKLDDATLAKINAALKPDMEKANKGSTQK